MIVAVSAVVALLVAALVASPHIPVWLADDLRSIRKRAQILVGMAAGALAVIADYAQQLNGLVPQISAIPGIDWLTASDEYRRIVGLVSLAAVLLSITKRGPRP